MERVASRIGVCPLYAEASRRSEQVSEALCGEPLVVRSSSTQGEDRWLRVEGTDGYSGWIPEAETTPIDAAWPGPGAGRVGRRWAMFRPDDGSGPRRLPFGAWVAPASEGRVRLADGATGRFPADWDTPFYEAVSDAATRLDRIVAGLLGVPYRWGGRSIDGLDCSGFVQLLALEFGVSVPRDAALQESWARSAATPVTRESLQHGDLLFWGIERATHVGIALDERRFAHARGWVRIGQWDGGADADLAPRFRGAYRLTWAETRARR